MKDVTQSITFDLNSDCKIESVTIQASTKEDEERLKELASRLMENINNPEGSKDESGK